MKLLESFKDSPYICYKKKQVKSEPTEAYVLLVTHILNNKKHVLLRKEIIKSDAFNNKHVNKSIKSGITSKSERSKEKRTCGCETNREEKNSITYDNDVNENTSSTSDKE